MNEWPAMVSHAEIQSRLINDGVPVERAMAVTTEVRTVPPGGVYRVEKPEGAILLHATNLSGWFAVTFED